MAVYELPEDARPLPIRERKLGKIEDEPVAVAQESFAALPQFGDPGVGELKNTRLVEPFGLRPCEMSCVCGP